MSLSVRENAGVSALQRLRRGPLLSRRKEIEVVSKELSSLDVKAPSLDASVAALSGGNQQKVVMARALLAEPAILIADEPTQGVDVGARAEIYRILRDVSDRGVPVVVASSDAKELEGLCDRVLVMSRGESMTVLDGGEVTEEGIVHAAMRADAHKRSRQLKGKSTPLRRFLRGDYVPVVILAMMMVALGAYIFAQLPIPVGVQLHGGDAGLHAALGFIAMGQTIALLMGGIDLSVGPLAGFLVVIASFFANDGKSVNGLARRARADVRRGGSGGSDERSAGPVREVHCGGSDPDDVHRPTGPELPATWEPRRLDRRQANGHHRVQGRAGSGRVRSVRA